MMSLFYDVIEITLCNAWLYCISLVHLNPIDWKSKLYSEKAVCGSVLQLLVWFQQMFSKFSCNTEWLDLCALYLHFHIKSCYSLLYKEAEADNEGFFFLPLSSCSLIFFFLLELKHFQTSFFAPMEFDFYKMRKSYTAWHDIIEQ